MANSLHVALAALLSVITLPDLGLAAIRIVIGKCHASGYLPGNGLHCTSQSDPDCCQTGQLYPQYNCSPPVTAATEAVMYVGRFSEGGGGGSQAACDGQYHSDDDLLVSLSTGWFDGGSRCLKNITIDVGGGRSAVAMVVDECDSINGCAHDQNYEPPCIPDAVNASPGVWRALGLAVTDSSEQDITWSDEPSAA